jgi:hypothetical protein
MEVADPLSIVPWGAYYPSAITGDITSGPLGIMGPQSAASAQVYAYVDVANARTTGTNFTLSTTIVDTAGGGAVVGRSDTTQFLAPGGWVRAVNIITLGTVQLWNTEASYLYTATTNVVVTGEGVVDSFSTRIGIRDAIWTPNTGFTLNGFKLPVHGVSNHQDFGGTGVAVPDRIDQFRVASLRAIGVNFWRTAHNPTNPELLDFCGAWHARVGRALSPTRSVYRIAHVYRPLRPHFTAHACRRAGHADVGGEPLHQPGRAAAGWAQGDACAAAPQRRRGGPAAAARRAGHGAP